ncbi:MAG: LacI family transcriptional regulator [Armatimonadota bacterium]|nr:LacI family transcriptional regulator [Armatimonadota bacterium]
MLKMSDIAKHAGVSPTTVSLVLNERHEALRISEKTRVKVLQAAEELGYRSNQWARAMRTGNSQMLGLLGGYTVEEQVGRMLAGALEAADAQGYTLKILRLDTLGGSAQQVIRRISELRLMGILALHLPEAILEELHTEAREYGTPLVLMDTRCENPDIAQVVSDDEDGIAAGVEHLVQLGHSKIAFISAGGKSTLGALRQEAFETAMARHLLAVPADYVQDGHFRLREPAMQAARALLSLPPMRRPTAIFCSSDLMALATLQVARELELGVPRDLSVVGFANMLVSEFAAPPLTTIDQPFVDMGRIAVDMLLTLVAERSQDENTDLAQPVGADTERPLNMKVLPTRLIKRASTAPPPN